MRVVYLCIISVFKSWPRGLCLTHAFKSIQFSHNLTCDPWLREWSSQSPSSPTRCKKEAPPPQSVFIGRSPQVAFSLLLPPDPGVRLTGLDCTLGPAGASRPVNQGWALFVVAAAAAAILTTNLGLAWPTRNYLSDLWSQTDVVVIVNYKCYFVYKIETYRLIHFCC